MAFVVVTFSAPRRGPDGKAFSEYEARAGFLAKPDVNALLFCCDNESCGNPLLPAT